ncbi:GNAT family N-acetyltransferase [Kitasatospora sp. NPDC001309]|uniref:GNAT family N-acetyltransferase n=1 Tax=Kitasatospora sp. NPDC001309 TaxID=3364013 RepID=UPI003682B6A8
METMLAPVRLARAGEGAQVSDLARLALHGAEPRSNGKSLESAVEEYGGRFRLPHGQAAVLVVDGPGGQLSGLTYFGSPVRLIQEYAELGAKGQRILADRLAEVELLAVRPESQSRGLGTALLTAGERLVAARGTRITLAKIRAGNLPVMRWYRRRGYTIAGRGESIILSVAGTNISFDDGGDGYQLAIKDLTGTGGFHRQRTRLGTHLFYGPTA